MKRQFFNKKLNAVNDMNVINLGNVIYVESTYDTKYFAQQEAAKANKVNFLRSMEDHLLDKIVEEDENSSFEENVLKN